MKKSRIEELEKCINSFKIISETESETVPSFLSIKRGEFLIKNGKTISREEFLANGSPCSASIILPITLDNEVILVVQPRPFLVGGVGIELPAGIIEKEEDPLISAERELVEETGYKANEMYEVVKFTQSHGFSRGIDHGYVAFGCQRISEQKLDNYEFIKIFICSFYELLDLVEMDYIKDANSLLVIEKAKKYIKRRNIIC